MLATYTYRELKRREEARWVKGSIWGFPKIRGTILGVPIIKIIVFWGLYWGPFILGNYHILHSIMWGIIFETPPSLNPFLYLTHRDLRHSPWEETQESPEFRGL